MTNNEQLELNDYEGNFTQNEADKYTHIEDSLITFSSKLKFTKDTTFSQCDISIKIPETFIEIEKGELILEDCNIILEGSSEGTLIHDRNGDILFDGCTITHTYKGSKQKFTFLNAEAQNKRVEFEGCTIENFVGRFIKSSSTNVKINHTKVTGLVGNFIVQENKINAERSSISIRKSDFSKCKYRTPEKKTASASSYLSETFYSRLAAVTSNSSLKDYEDSNYSSLIYIANVSSVTVSECAFKGCSINCIKLSDGEVRAKANVTNCSFDNCIVPKSYDHNDEKNVLTSFRFILHIEKCKFNKIYGVNINAQLVRNEIIGCQFTNCKKDELGEGFLSILVDVDEPIILVKDCVFKKCINEDRYKPDSSGILYLYSGLVEKGNKETVLIDNCKFVECEAVKEIRGVEKQDGFFGSSVKLYKMI